MIRRARGGEYCIWRVGASENGTGYAVGCGMAWVGAAISVELVGSARGGLLKRSRLE